jgi:hypothetical protein
MNLHLLITPHDRSTLVEALEHHAAASLRCARFCASKQQQPGAMVNLFQAEAARAAVLARRIKGQTT